VRTITILAIIVFAAGCASLPPTVDEGEYQNYQYGFIVQLPRDGWERVRSVPAGFAPYLLAEAPSRLLLLLHNPRTAGLIAVQGGTLPLHYENVLTLQDRFTEFIQSFLDLQWFQITGDDPGVRGSYRITHCDASGLQWQERAGSRSTAGILHASLGSVYPVKGDTNAVTFYVFSGPDTYEENRIALYRMAGTFSSGEVFTMRAYAR
jgi:hypothetical protein